MGSATSSKKKPARKKVIADEDKPLTDKQWRFVHEYAVDLKGKQAALRAGFAASAADSTASKLLAMPKIRKAVDDELAKKAKRSSWDQDRMLRMLSDQLLADDADLFDEATGAVKPVHEWPKTYRQGMVKRVKVKELFEGVGQDRKHIGNEYAVEMVDRFPRMLLMAKHLGMAGQNNQPPEPSEQEKALFTLRNQIANTGLEIAPEPEDDEDGTTIEGKARETKPYGTLTMK